MKKWFFAVLLLTAIGKAVHDLDKVLKMKSALEKQVESNLDLVNPTSLQGVAESTVRRARWLGINLTTNDVQVLYQDTDVESAAQRLVGKIGMQFQNKRATIVVRYDASICGVPWAQEIRQTKLKQVAATPPPAQREAQRVLDSEN